MDSAHASAPQLGAAILLAVALATACSTTYKPCTQGGDVSWFPPLKGDMRCQQRESPSGHPVNHGSFRLFHPDGKVALEGEFEDGRKTGTWIQYNGKGERIAERYFEGGVEKTPPKRD